jgi:hypothetical protein
MKGEGLEVRLSPATSAADGVAFFATAWALSADAAACRATSAAASAEGRIPCCVNCADASGIHSMPS